MQWEWLVLIIPVVMWILANVIRGPEDAPPDVRRRRLPEVEQEAQPGAPRPQQPSEVERFLEEINRMRQRTAEEARPQEPRPQPRPAELPRRAQRPPRPRPVPVQPQSRPRTEQRQTSAPQVVRSVRPVSPPPPPVPVLMAEVVDVLPVTPLSPAPTLAATQVVEAPVALALRNLIRNPHTLAAAIVLNEVLGPPRCRRRVRY